MYSLSEQITKIKRGTEEIINLPELEKKISLKRPLIVKAGFDPSAPDIHLGHTVLLRKMRHFQELGHDVYFLIGDFTGRIGDPSGRSKTRKTLSQDEVRENAATYKKQIFKILAKDKTKIVFNSKWCSKLGTEGISDLLSRYTVARMLERNDFQNRYKKNEPISMIEFLYPLLQGYDSVVMKADVELGGTDQKFNLLVGRDLQRSYGIDEQVVITLPILEGLAGVDKMSKSLNNYVGINDAPDEMFGKIMSISDSLMWRYYELLTDEDYLKIKASVESGGMHPKKVKSDLAKTIVAEYHDRDAAAEACKNFETVFTKRKEPEEMPEYFFTVPEINPIDAMVKTGCAGSKSEARRLIEQGAVFFDGKKIEDINMKLDLDKAGKILKVGKRRFRKIFQKKA
ncbi:MAG: tyrosine--tRNA ligase [Candidatus Omnitrophota bacterium]